MNQTNLIQIIFSTTNKAVPNASNVSHCGRSTLHCVKIHMQSIYDFRNRHRTPQRSISSLCSQPRSVPHTWLIGVWLWSEFQFVHWMLVDMFLSSWMAHVPGFPHSHVSSDTLKCTSLIDKNLILPPCPYMVWFPCSLSWPGPLTFLIGCSCLESTVFFSHFFFFLYMYSKIMRGGVYLKWASLQW